MKKELMLYSMDYSWAGMIVVVAYTEDEARSLMSQFENYDTKYEITCSKIEAGLVLYNYGDL